MEHIFKEMKALPTSLQGIILDFVPRSSPTANLITKVQADFSQFTEDYWCKGCWNVASKYGRCVHQGLTWQLFNFLQEYKAARLISEKTTFFTIWNFVYETTERQV